MNNPQQAAFSAVLKTFSKNKIMVDTREDGIYIRLAGKPEQGFVFSLDWWKVFDFGKKSNTASYAKRELDILVKSSTDPENRPIIEPFTSEILLLCDKFGNSGQSGGSAPFTATAISQAIKKLLLQEPICPITGIEEEWVNVADMGDGENEKDCVWQNNRCSALFKNSEGKSWYLDAIIVKNQHGQTYCTNAGAICKDGSRIYSRNYIKSFPFTPKTFYIDVIEKEIAKDDCEFYVKDEKQLKRVWKYYERYA